MVAGARFGEVQRIKKCFAVQRIHIFQASGGAPPWRGDTSDSPARLAIVAGLNFARAA